RNSLRFVLRHGTCAGLVERTASQGGRSTSLGYTGQSLKSAYAGSHLVHNRTQEGQCANARAGVSTALSTVTAALLERAVPGDCGGAPGIVGQRITTLAAQGGHRPGSLPQASQPRAPASRLVGQCSAHPYSDYLRGLCSEHPDGSAERSALLFLHAPPGRRGPAVCVRPAASAVRAHA